jgi:osmotically-inducible protein OsmY
MQPLASEVMQAAKDRLQQSPHVALREVTCEFRQGLLVLRGRVPTFYHKQLAQETIAHMEGVVGVINDIEVGHY